MVRRNIPRGDRVDDLAPQNRHLVISQLLRIAERLFASLAMYLVMPTVEMLPVSRRELALALKMHLWDLLQPGNCRPRSYRAYFVIVHVVCEWVVLAKGAGEPLG